MIALNRTPDGIWSCTEPEALRQWLQEFAGDLGWRQVEAFLDHRYKHLGSPTEVERAWAAIGEARITRALKGCLSQLSEGRTWREPPGFPASGLAPVLRWVLPVTMRVAGEAGLAPAPTRKVAVGHSELVVFVLTNRGAPPGMQKVFSRLGGELARRGGRVVTAAAGPAEQDLLRAMGSDGLARARVILTERQPQPAIPGLSMTRLSELPKLLEKAQARMHDWLPAWRGDDEERDPLLRDVALLYLANSVIAWSQDGEETGRVALPLFAARQNSLPVLNLGAGATTLEKAVSTLDAWERTGLKPAGVEGD